jgi:hypothetical protein
VRVQLTDAGNQEAQPRERGCIDSATATDFPAPSGVQPIIPPLVVPRSLDVRHD